MDYTETSRLLIACAAGDEFAIECLVNQYQAGVFKVALLVLDDPAEASEASQDTFVKALAALDSYQDRTTFRAWLFRIALNESLSRLRKRTARARLQRALATMFRLQSQTQITPEDGAIQTERARALWMAIGTLGSKHRIPLILRYDHELPIAEIAQILNISEGTVHSRLHVARDRLRTKLAKDEEIDRL